MSLSSLNEVFEKVHQAKWRVVLISRLLTLNADPAGGCLLVTWFYICARAPRGGRGGRTFPSCMRAGELANYSCKNGKDLIIHAKGRLDHPLRILIHDLQFIRLPAFYVCYETLLSVSFEEVSGYFVRKD